MVGILEQSMARGGGVCAERDEHSFHRKPIPFRFSKHLTIIITHKLLT